MYSLFIVATPIGNLEDITLRALRILSEVYLIAAEDTRKTRILLNRYDIKTPITSYYEHNKLTKLDYILNTLQKGDVALVSEAGTPGINDPGYELIKSAIEKNIPVVPIPGPSVVAAAVTISGLPTDRFAYFGFLPNRKIARSKFLQKLLLEPATIIFLESPHRVKESLEDMLGIFGDRQIAVCREMTKVHEEIFRGRISEAITRFEQPRGEFTLVVEGQRYKDNKPPEGNALGRIAILKKAGITAKEAINILAAETNLTRRELYRKWLDTKNF